MTAVDATAGFVTPGPPGYPGAPMAPVGTGSGRFIGQEWAYWRILIRGGVLLMFTLGIYRFWLATDMRRFLWANTDIAGETLEYTGTARELLLGFLIAIALLVPIYTGFFIATLDLGMLGQLSGVLAFVALALLGHFAVYRARRYRLTRTIYRGVRFYQTGSAIRYAACAMFWWVLSILTLGLAYPWGQASLERYKMRNTYYGDLTGHFAGSGTKLFLRGILLWLVVVGPMLVGLLVAVGGVNWTALAEALARGGDNVLGRIESSNPNFTASMGFAVIAMVWTVLAAAVLYPAFQALMLRWWISGLQFGPITATSRLRTGQMYGLYLRFLGISMLFATAAGIASGMVIAMFGIASESTGNQDLVTIAGAVIAVIAYVIIMLGYSTIYQGTVKLRQWRLSFETVELSGLQALDNVKARGAASSPFGEGLADALNVGGI